MVGTDARHTTSVPGALLGTPKRNREERLGHAEAMRLLEFVGISHRAEEVARNLPYGDQRRLEIARAIATQPKVLLLDEPAAGFNPAEKQALVALIRQIRDTGLTVVLIEHDMEVVMDVCDRIAVIDFGEKIAEGLPQEIQTRRTCHPGVPGGRRRCSLSWRTSTSTTARSRPSRASRSRVAEGEIVTLIGANGAGKTTTLKTISGVRPVTSGRITFDGEDITGMAAVQARRPRPAPGARGPRDLPGHVRAGEPRDGRLRPPGQGHGRRPRARVRAVPPPARAPHAARRHALGRRAADAGHRPGADGPAQAAAPRRAVDGPRTEAGRPDLRDHHRDQRAGHDDPARRAERHPGAPARPPGLRAGGGPGREDRRRERPARRRRGPGRLPGNRGQSAARTRRPRRRRRRPAPRRAARPCPCRTGRTRRRARTPRRSASCRRPP